MFRIAIQIKELVSSNVTSALDTASNPAKMLNRLLREIEESLIGLTGELTKARRQKERLEIDMTQAELRESDWSDKVKTAMDHGREDLARQALLAREDCRVGIARLQHDATERQSVITEMEEAESQLEAKRTEVRTRIAEQQAVDGDGCGGVAAGGFARRTERRMDHIVDLEKRTEFATETTAASRANAAVEREIEEMRRARAIEEELAILRGGAAASEKPQKKAAKRAKTA